MGSGKTLEMPITYLQAHLLLQPLQAGQYGRLHRMLPCQQC